MFFRKKKEKATKKIDKLVTGFIIGWAVAWMIGLSQTKKWKQVTWEIKIKSKNIFEKTHSLFWKTMIKLIKFTKKNNKND